MIKYIILIIYVFILTLSSFSLYRDKESESRELLNYSIKVFLLCMIGVIICIRFSNNKYIFNYLFRENISINIFIEFSLLFILIGIIFSLYKKRFKDHRTKSYFRKYLLFFIIPVILDYKGTKEIILSKEIYSMKVWYIPFAIGFGYFVLKIYMSIIGRGLSLKLAGYRSYAQTIRDMFLHQLLYVNFPEEFLFRIYVSKYYTSLGVINVSIISSLFFGLAHILYMDVNRKFKYKFIQAMLIHTTLGMFLSLIWCIERSIIFNWALHMIYNLSILGYKETLLKRFNMSG